MKDRYITSPIRSASLIAVLAVGVLGLAGRAAASDEGQFEYWAKAIFEVPLGEQWEFTFEERLTFGDDARRLADQQMDFVFTYSGPADWLSLGLGYKQTLEKDEDDWRLENRPYLNVTATTTLGGLPVASRSRFEYRDEEGEDPVWRYRNRIAVTSPRTFTPLELRPYLAEEFFVNFDDEDFNQQRLYGGFFIPLYKQVRLELFYLWKLDEEDDRSWHDTNVLGSFLYFQF